MDMSGDAVFRLSDYRPPDYLTETAALSFALDPARTVVRNLMSVRRATGVTPQMPLRLDGLRLELLSLRLDGEILAPSRFEQTPTGLIVFDVPEAFSLEVETAIAPESNKSGHGLFFLGGKLATQCEPQGFRQMTYFIDRPDNPTRFQVRLTADKARFPVLLSNGNIAEAGDLPDGRHFVAWDDPFPKPSYIFAVMAGDFGVLGDTFTTKSGREIQLGIYADRDVLPGCTFAMDVVKRSLAWDEETFGLEYDLDHYNIVALRGWGGAMENKGLNLFGVGGIVTDPETTTDDDYVIIERIIGHEQFHNWTGNRVTCRDWFQLSLKEGLTRLRDQLFIGAKLGFGAWRIENARALRRNQFPEDDGPAAHPIQPAACVTVNSFYTNTIYDKGAEVVRMFIAVLGWEAFRKGFDLYIARHDGQAITTEEFVKAMEDASGRDLTQFRRWYHQGGRPRIEASGHYDAEAQTYALTLKQSCRVLIGAPPPEPFHIPIAAGLVTHDGGAVLSFTRNGEASATETMLELTEAVQTFVFANVASAPVPSLLRGFSAPVTVVSSLPDEDLAVLMTHDADPFGRWDASQMLGIRLIRRLAADHAAGRALTVPEDFAAAFAATLADPSIGDLLKSQILSLPDEPVLSEGLATIDLDGHLTARTFLRRALALRLKDALLDTYHACAERGAYAPDFESIGRRRLKNVCLELLMALATDEIADLALAQVRTAGNMTDRFEALCCLVNVEGPQREAAIAEFGERWQRHDIAIDKWFTAQAMARGPGAAARIIALKDHPLLDPDNNARAMAYYGWFFRQNRVAFHDPSGAGYRFLADRLIEMDRMGRQRSHWLMPQINLWRRYDAPRRALMRAELERIAATPGISQSLRDNVRRALDSED
ncbi:Aminopeptidase N [Alphaproteobacteria bacterium SO-S41]|nr:Aminopeptidase N [Alphaproteobacteria bacterium SO-S41]